MMVNIKVKFLQHNQEKIFEDQKFFSCLVSTRKMYDISDGWWSIDPGKSFKSFTNQL